MSHVQPYVAALWSGTVAAVGDDIGGTLGEIARIGGVASAGVFGFIIVMRAYRERDALQQESISSLKEENELLKDELRRLRGRRPQKD
jgi:hypothetical protein